MSQKEESGSSDLAIEEVLEDIKNVSTQVVQRNEDLKKKVGMMLRRAQSLNLSQWALKSVISSIIHVTEDWHVSQQQVPAETLDSQQHFVEQEFMSQQLPSLTQANLTEDNLSQANLSPGFLSLAFQVNYIILKVKMAQPWTAKSPATLTFFPVNIPLPTDPRQTCDKSSSLYSNSSEKPLQSQQPLQLISLTKLTLKQNPQSFYGPPITPVEELCLIAHCSLFFLNEERESPLFCLY